MKKTTTSTYNFYLRLIDAHLIENSNSTSSVAGKIENKFNVWTFS